MSFMQVLKNLKSAYIWMHWTALTPKSTKIFHLMLFNTVDPFPVMLFYTVDPFPFNAL